MGICHGRGASTGALLLMVTVLTVAGCGATRGSASGVAPATIEAAPAGTAPAATPSGVLSPELLAVAQRIAGQSMTAPGKATVVEASFDRVNTVVWQGAQTFGDVQRSYRSHRLLVVEVTENVFGLMRRPPPRAGVSPSPAAALTGQQIYYDETLKEEISITSWAAQPTDPVDLHSIGTVVTIDVPAQAIPPRSP